MQGVSINLFIKTGKKKPNELGKVFHFDLFGKREFKYDFLLNKRIKTVGYSPVQIAAPNYYFIPKDFNDTNEYSKGFALVDLMPFKSSGIKTHDDPNLVSSSVKQLEKNIEGLNHVFDKSKVLKYSYRPFDSGFVYYDTKLLGRAREKTIYHLKYDNIGLILVAQPQAANLNFFDCLFLTNCFTDTNMYRRGGPSAFPLYLYPENKSQKTLYETQERTPNLNKEIVEKIAADLGLTFTAEKVHTPNPSREGNKSFAPIDILDYIYAVLHSPAYREKYKEFLKIDFPRVPYPKDASIFWSLVKLGGELRTIHLLESVTVNKPITSFPFDGDNVVGKISFKESYEAEEGNKKIILDPAYPMGNVYINEKQCFQMVPKVAWEFYIGGYQPAQKWLKDRKGRALSYDDIIHYQKIIVALTETERLMKEIDKIKVE